MTPQGRLGSTQAAVLAALIRRAGSGPVTVGQLARDVGISRAGAHRAVQGLEAQDLLVRTQCGPVPLVQPIEVSRVRDYTEGRHESGRAPAQTGPDRAQQPSIGEDH